MKFLGREISVIPVWSFVVPLSFQLWSQLHTLKCSHAAIHAAGRWSAALEEAQRCWTAKYCATVAGGQPSNGCWWEWRGCLSDGWRQHLWIAAVWWGQSNNDVRFFLFVMFVCLCAAYSLFWLSQASVGRHWSYQMLTSQFLIRQDELIIG